MFYLKNEINNLQLLQFSRTLESQRAKAKQWVFSFIIILAV